MRTFCEFAENRKLNLRFVESTIQDRAKGLMFQDPLRSNEAALFVYHMPTQVPFWNKNVNFPIQVAFFDENQKLIDIGKLEADQDKMITCQLGRYKYVLEVSDGYFTGNEIGKSLEDFI